MLVSDVQPPVGWNPILLFILAPSARMTGASIPKEGDALALRASSPSSQLRLTPLQAAPMAFRRFLATRSVFGALGARVNRSLATCLAGGYALLSARVVRRKVPRMRSLVTPGNRRARPWAVQ